MKRTLFFIALLIVATGAVAKTANVPAMVRANTEVFDAAMRAGNADAFMAFYGADAVLMPPNAPAFNGAENVRKFWGGLLAAGATDVDLVTDDVLVSGDLAVERGHYQLTKPFSDTGKYLVVWRNRGGKWQIIDDIFNSSVAAPQPQQ